MLCIEVYMDDLDLMDKSCNDYQLINELAMLVRNYRDNCKCIDKFFVNRVIDICCMNDEIILDNDFVGSSFDIDSYGYCEGNSIFFNYGINEFNLKSFDSLGSFYNLGDNNKLLYFTTLVTLIHEFTHIKQCSNLTDSSFGRIYRYCYDIIHSDYVFYNNTYEFNPLERYAEVRANYISTMVLEKVYGSCNYFNRILLWKLIYDYIPDNVCPLRKFNNSCKAYDYDDFEKLIPNVDINDYCLWDRLYAGYDISFDEYVYLTNLYYRMVDGDNSFDNSSVKKLVFNFNRH